MSKIIFEKTLFILHILKFFPLVISFSSMKYIGYISVISINIISKMINIKRKIYLFFFNPF